jgi:GH24 family phage-related lysozyme (muramidase)
MNRKPIFDAVRAQGVDFNRPGAVEILDNALSLLGMPREDALAPSSVAVALIQRFEGCRLQAYPDPGTGRDPWTIGWGSTTDELGQAIKPGTIWTQERADSRLKDQVRDFGNKVAAVLDGVPTTQHQFDAMVSLAYNIGIRAFADSTLVKRHKEGAYAGAALEFLRWNKAGGKVLAGLTKRRDAESWLYKGLTA